MRLRDHVGSRQQLLEDLAHAPQLQVGAGGFQARGWKGKGACRCPLPWSVACKGCYQAVLPVLLW